MKTPHRVAFALTLVFATSLATARFLQAGEEDEQGWTTLFNGENLDGWRFHLGKEGADNAGTFTVDDGVIVCTGKPSGYMYTQGAYSNFTLEFELAFKRPEGLTNDSDFRGNSGCLIHIGEKNALGVWPRSVGVPRNG